MKCVLGSDFMIVKIGQFAKGKTMTVSNLRNILLLDRRWHGTLHDPSCRIYMIYYIKRRCFILHGLEHIHKTEHVFCIIEITGTYVLDIHNDSTETLEFLKSKLDMVSLRSKFRITRREDLLQISPLSKNVIPVSSLLSIPAVLCTEVSDPAVKQSLVKLVLKGCGSE